MNFKDAVERCHVRSGIYRLNDPMKVYTQEDLEKSHPALQSLNVNRVGKLVPKVYYKNHTESLESRVSEKDQKCTDWEEFDPREQESCSEFNEMPA